MLFDSRTWLFKNSVVRFKNLNLCNIHLLEYVSGKSTYCSPIGDGITLETDEC